MACPAFRLDRSGAGLTVAPAADDRFQEALLHQQPERLRRAVAQHHRVLVDQLGDRVQDPPGAQRAVAHPGEARADRVHLGGPAHAAVLTQHHMLRVLRAGQPDLLLHDLRAPA